MLFFKRVDATVKVCVYRSSYSDKAVQLTDIVIVLSIHFFLNSTLVLLPGRIARCLSQVPNLNLAFLLCLPENCLTTVKLNKIIM